MKNKKNQKLGIILVNLISPDYLVRHQAPFAIYTLAGYLKKKIKGLDLGIIDMQSEFDNFNKRSQATIKEKFDQTIESVVRLICNFCENKAAIVGLSLKWSTQNVARVIAEKVKNKLGKDNLLFVLGNIGSTYGYDELLKQPSFENTLAVVSEGEEALTKIVKRALKNKEDISNTENYSRISNVARKVNQKIILNGLKRVDLKNYPQGTMDNALELYDKEFKSHAMESSRGCPWGNCTFCSIKSQFSGLNPKCLGDSSWQAFPLKLVISNIRQLVKKGITNFDFKDSEFFGPVRQTDKKDRFFESMQRAQSFAKQIIKLNRGLKKNKKIVINHISARVDTVFQEGQFERNKIREQTYKLLKKAGVKRIFVGIESGSPSQIKRFAKGVSIDENKEALKILRRLGYEIEVGFIFFDPFVTMKELGENIKFIEETELYKTDSRILGSLRIQEGCNYMIMAKKAALLGKRDHNLLCYSGKFKHHDVSSLESLFSQCERITMKLIRLLPASFRLECYKMNFSLVKNLVNCYLDGKSGKVNLIIENFAAEQKNYLLKIKRLFDVKSLTVENEELFEEYLVYALKNNALLVRNDQVLYLNDLKFEMPNKNESEI